jgi:two-component system phosphate regulon sensor histidine kinase PhoR
MKGTGLGLAIVKHILMRHQGRLGVDSEPGRGARFTVELPAPVPNAPEQDKS